MQENAIKQRVRMIKAIWEEQLRLPENQEAVLCCIMGQGTVDYRMIKGFLMVQLSEESNLPDVFMLTHAPFKAAAGYPEKIIGGIAQYVQAWNQDPELAGQQHIDWAASAFDPQSETPSDWFIENLNRLCQTLKVDAGQETLTLALLPEPLENPTAFSEWIMQVAEHENIDPGLRFLVFDLYESPLYQTAETLKNGRKAI